MTKQEINEYLAERLFGLEKGKDWGQQSKHNFVWYSADELGDEEGAYKCLLCEKYFAKEVDEVCYIKQPPDYIKNYQAVLEALGETLPLNYVIEIFLDGAKYKYGAYICDKKKYSVIIDDWYGESNQLGEAICRAAVEYLKTREGK